MVIGTSRTAKPWVRWGLRAATTLVALDAYAQAVLAGRFLSGDVGMLLGHRYNGTDGVVALSVVLIVMTVIAWRSGQVSGHLVALSVVLTGLVVLQVAMGFNRVLGVHIPLGVGIIALATVLAVWAWRR
jgi:heme A synthase